MQHAMNIWESITHFDSFRNKSFVSPLSIREVNGLFTPSQASTLKQLRYFREESYLLRYQEPLSGKPATVVPRQPPLKVF